MSEPKSSLVAVTGCPRCGGRLTIGDDPKHLTGAAILWLNCEGCGLFQLAEREAKP